VPKSLPDAALETLLDYVDLADTMYVCSTLPAQPTYAQVTAAALASVAVTPNTDFTKADGTTGRKFTVAAKSGVSVTASGTANHIALCTTSGSVVRAVTTCTSQALTSGNTVNIPTWTLEVGDPT